ncbi:MAG TPA: enoyl-CoA hydratase/isomerase family protein [Pseudomonadales bacterium]|nr:enoyl-CoA hydratase/isomerase family protein [Pseudomonadales bacterium]HNN35651.1 enoyl-CoA hydratase/isomerase family protein [Pseudomonadales bacterium]
MDSAAVLFSFDDGVAEITLNRPDNRNSMTPDLIAGFAEAMARLLEIEAEVRCLIITGRGSSFCAGGDFSGDRVQQQLPHERLLATYRSFLQIAELKMPVIGALNGHAIGGGFGVALICDLRIANRDALYGANFARLGLHSGMSISYMLPRIVGLPRAAELLFTGRRINGAEAEQIGLVNAAVEAEQVLPRARALAREIAVCAPVAVRMMKRSLYLNAPWDPQRAADFEAHCQSRTFETEDSREGITALLEKREPRFQGR